MDVCPSTAIRYSSRKKAYEKFGKIKTMEIVSELLEKETKKLARDAGKVDNILNKISRDVSFEHTEDEFEIDITDKLKDEIRAAMDGALEIEDIKDVIESTVPKRNIAVVEESCIGCGACIGTCPVEAIELEMPSPVHVGEECIYCGKCVETCPFGSIVLKEEYYDTHDNKIFFVRKNLEGPRTGEIAIDSETCQLCGVCVNKCPKDAMSIEEGKVVVDTEKCIVCDTCEVTCPVGAVKLKAP
jgi:energy-converting hydrogenase A subunit Q